MKIAPYQFSILLLVLPGLAFAELQPEEVAVIAVRSSPESVDIAQYYAKARGIPPAHICLIDVAPGKNLDRAVWANSVRPAIRSWILDQRLESQLRCLVTVWDVPLKISKQTDNIESRRAFLEAEKRLRRRAVSESLARIDGILADNEPVAPPEFPDDANAKEVTELLQAALQAAQGRMALADPGAVQAANLQILQLVGELGGVAVGLQVLAGRSPAATPPDLEMAKRIEFGRGRLLGLRDARSAVEQMPESIERDEQILTIVASAEGHIGVLQWIDRQLQLLEKNETYSSFDSELSLLFWLDYPLDRWQPNLLHYQFDNSDLRTRRPTLMVSRLEGPTVAHSKRLIDDAIATEAAGLGGKVYLDARGIPGPSEPISRGSYGEYDQAIRDLASLLEEHTEKTVVLNDEKELFQDGQCPDTGLYCGWYSLGKYVDAFEFVRGAVGYHIASSEATTLRSPDSQVWCKRMLEDGICATLGPVHEPYLSAFPRPDEFFIALLSGKYSLAECYYRTKPFNSWVMILVGDPLYNPFRTGSGLDVERLPERLKKVLEASAEESKSPLPDSDLRRKSPTVMNGQSRSLGTGHLAIGTDTIGPLLRHPISQRHGSPH